jgi:hypothetical protein
MDAEARCTGLIGLSHYHATGRRNPTITVVEKLARPFGVGAGRLLD